MNTHSPKRRRSTRGEESLHGLRRRDEPQTSRAARWLRSIRKRASTWCLVILAVCLNSYTAVRAQTEPVTASEPIILLVASTSAAQEFREEVTVTTAGLPAAFRSSPVAWAPKPDGQQPLKRLGDPAGEERLLQIGTDAQAGSFLKLEFTRPHLVEGAMASKLAISIEDPRDLEVGIYEGFIDAKMRLAVGPTTELEYRWPVVVMVEGRNVLDVSFAHGQAHGGSLSVGTPASATITVDILGDYELGQGTLELGMLPSAASARYTRLLRTLPVPRAEPFDCLLDLGEDGSFCDVVHWKRDQIIYTRMLPADAQIARAVPQRRSRYHDAIRARYQKDFVVQRLAFEVVLPDCYETGILRATARWPHVDPEGSPQEVVTEEEVGPGILISAHAGFVGERIDIALVTLNALANPTVDILGRGTEQLVERVELVKSRRTSIDPRASVYGGSFQVRQEPPFALIVRGVGTAATLNPASLDVYFSRTTSFPTKKKATTGLRS